MYRTKFISLNQKLIVDMNRKYKDDYWELLTIFEKDEKGNLEEYNTALCLKQKHFKKLIDLLKYDVNNQNCFSEERYPNRYPCLVQLWSHFEGGMINTSIDYNVPEDILAKYKK